MSFGRGPGNLLLFNKKTDYYPNLFFGIYIKVLLFSAEHNMSLWKIRYMYSDATCAYGGFLIKNNTFAQISEYFLKCRV